ncbi:MAG: hypothetical protein ACI4WY_07625 [Anaerovoracaceae bacterium]
MTDEIFRSMKAQMEPSDDVVADLLAKIALESPSPVTENESGNVISFRQAAEEKSARTKHFAKKTKKSIWYYGTAVAASVIVMISTFTLLGLGDEDQSNAGDLLQNVIGPDSSVVNPADPDSTTEHPRNAEDPSGESSEDPGSSKDSESPESTDPAGENSNTGDKTDSSAGKKDPADKTDSQTGNEGSQNYDDPDANSSNDNGTGSEGNDSPQPPADNGKVTPGASGTADISWTNEIVNSSQVASISVSGSNYVVSSTVSKSDVDTTLETVTIDLPQTSTTNAAKVKAKVCKVKNVSSEAVVALDVDGFKEPLVYANADYSPATLGQFVSDLGLSGNITFSRAVRCQISHVGYSSNQSYKTDVDSAAWTWLLCQSEAERAGKGSFNNGNSKALFTSASNPTGSQMKFGVSDNGYLWISMLGKEFTFHIGSSNAKGFLETVTGETLG